MERENTFIAEFLGWVGCLDGAGFPPGENQLKPIPDFSGSLDVMATAESELTTDEFEKYIRVLKKYY